MIATIEELKKIDKFKTVDDDLLIQKLEAIETFIRGSYTNNKFYNRHVKFKAQSSNNKILAVHPYLKVGDTIEIVESPNQGLYVIKAISETEMTLDKEIFNFNSNYIIKVEYPADVKFGCLDILEWVFGAKSKVGLKSETLSRHSVTYEDSASFVNGYPKSLLGFLEPYRKMRF